MKLGWGNFLNAQQCEKVHYHPIIILRYAVEYCAAQFGIIGMENEGEGNSSTNVMVDDDGVCVGQTLVEYTGRTAAGNNGALFYCEKCRRSYWRKNRLEKHMQSLSRKNK